MSSKTISRFEELDAGRALGDLSPEEVAEWKTLSLEGTMDQTIDFGPRVLYRLFCMEEKILIKIFPYN